jgi:cytidine deaminase
VIDGTDLVGMVSQGDIATNYPEEKVMAIAIAANHKGSFTEDVITPCGACRQVLLETENRFHSPMKVLMYSEKGVYVMESIRDLLPLSFGDEMLK